MAFPRLILREKMHRLGRPGLVAAALWLAGLAYGLGWVLPASQQRDQVQAQLAQAEARWERVPAGQAAPQTAAQRDQSFYQALTAQDAVSAAIERLYAAAAAEQISLERGEYAQAAIASTRLVRYQIVLPLQADYGQIRRFVDSSTADVAGLRLDDISLQRKDIAQTQLEARLQFSLYLARR